MSLFFILHDLNIKSKKNLLFRGYSLVTSSSSLLPGDFYLQCFTNFKVRIPFLTFFFCKMTKILNFLTNILVKNKKMCYNEIKIRTKEKKDMLKNRLKELRARDGLNQTELAKLAGVSRQTISLLERDEYTPSIVIALKIAQIFHEPVESVFHLEEEE